MKSLRAVLLIFVIMIASGCSHYPDITGRVIDNATGKPIEGALVVAQWTKKHGFGLTNTTLSKITETLTDKEGKFSLSGSYDPFVEPPEMIIYKEGYTPWRNDSIFPSCNLVKENEWKNNVTYKLDIFSDKYTAVQLSRFMNYGIIGLGDAPIFHKIYNGISDKAVDEIDAIKSKQQQKQ
jgi:hypothetical protein